MKNSFSKNQGVVIRNLLLLYTLANHLEAPPLIFKH